MGSFFLKGFSFSVSKSKNTKKRQLLYRYLGVWTPSRATARAFFYTFLFFKLTYYTLFTSVQKSVRYDVGTESEMKRKKKKLFYTTELKKEK